MNVLYVGQLWHGGTCAERMKILREAGWQVIPFDTTPYLQAGNRLLASLQHRLLWGPDVHRFNRALSECAKSAQRVDVVWVDKGRWLWAETLEKIKRTSGAIAIHYTPDPAFTVHDSRHFDACLPAYDLCVTTKRYELETYIRRGARETLFALQGIDDRFEHLEACGRLDEPPLDVIFIGHREPHYIERLAALLSAGIPVRVHGSGWSRLGRRQPWTGVVHDAVWGDEYARTLAQARIGLGLLSKMYPDAFTTRSFEIPAAGAMLMAERTAEHEQLFEEDREAVFFGSDEEMCDKIHFYVRNDAARRVIAQAGRKRALSQYHWRSVMQPILSRVTEFVDAT